MYVFQRILLLYYSFMTRMALIWVELHLATYLEIASIAKNEYEIYAK